MDRESTARSETDSITLLDCHVHIYPCSELDTLFDAAYTNFEHAAVAVGVERFRGVILLTESAAYNTFSTLRNATRANKDDSKPSRWTIAPTQETESLRIVSKTDSNKELLLIAGRQIETRETLEVAALCTDKLFADGQEIEQCLLEIRNSGGVPVLPWGVGKWFGRRGRIVSELVRQDPSGGLLLGDISGRPTLWPRPRVFDLGPRKVLPGADNLPLAGEEHRVGAYGLLLKQSLSVSRPAAELREILTDPNTGTLTHYGQRQGVFTFLKSQIALRRQSDPGQTVDHLPETPDIETSSARYASRFAGPAGEYLLGAQNQAIERVLATPFGDTVLDVGGGHAQLTGLLLKRAREVTVLGSDETCQQRLHAYTSDPKLRLASGDLLCLPFPDRSFDLVISVRLISHIENRDQLISEFCRVAKRAVVIDYPSWISLNALTPLLFPLKKRIEGNTRTYHSFFGSQLVRAFRQRRFKFHGRVSQLSLPMVVHRRFGGAKWPQRVERLCQTLGITLALGNPVILRVDRIILSPHPNLLPRGEGSIG